MSFEKLEHNLTEIIKEAQIKLGYESHELYFNYPLSSLCHLIGENIGMKEMGVRLTEFSEYAEKRLGKIKFTEKEEGIFTLCVPAKGADHVHSITSENEFLSDFINAVRNHYSMEKLFELFRKYSDNVNIEEQHNGEFDYLVYFEDGTPDDFYYCLADDMDHVTYHRFTAEDYRDFNF